MKLKANIIFDLRYNSRARMQVGLDVDRSEAAIYQWLRFEQHKFLTKENVLISISKVLGKPMNELIED